MQSLRYSIGDFLISDSCLSANVHQESLGRGILFESPQRPNFWTLFFFRRGRTTRLFASSSSARPAGRRSAPAATSGVSDRVGQGRRGAAGQGGPSGTGRGGAGEGGLLWLGSAAGWSGADKRGGAQGREDSVVFTFFVLRDRISVQKSKGAL